MILLVMSNVYWTPVCSDIEELLYTRVYFLSVLVKILTVDLFGINKSSTVLRLLFKLSSKQYYSCTHDK